MKSIPETRWCNGSPAPIPHSLFWFLCCQVYKPCSRLDLPPAVVLALETLAACPKSSSCLYLTCRRPLVAAHLLQVPPQQKALTVVVSGRGHGSDEMECASLSTEAVEVKTTLGWSIRIFALLLFRRLVALLLAVFICPSSLGGVVALWTSPGTLL